MVLDVDGVVPDFVSIEVLALRAVLICKNLLGKGHGRGEIAFHCRIHHVGLAGMEFLLDIACCVEKHLENRVLDVETEYSRNRDGVEDKSGQDAWAGRVTNRDIILKIDIVGEHNANNLAHRALKFGMANRVTFVCQIRSYTIPFPDQ